MPAITGSVSITGTPTIANTVFGATQSGVWNVGLSAGSNVIGSISNTGFGIIGTLPAFASTPTFNVGTGAFVDRTTDAAPYSNRLSDGTSFYDARSIRALTSADQVTIANASIPVTGTFFQATQPVSAASLPLPTGAATETTLGLVNTSLNTIKSSVGTVAAGVAATASQLIGGVFNTIKPVLTTGQQAALQTNKNAALKVDTDMTEPYGLTLSASAADIGSVTTVGANGQEIYSGTPTGGSSAQLLFLNLASRPSSVKIQISNTWVATLSVEGSMDNGVTYFKVPFIQDNGSITSTLTANAIGNVNATGLNIVRVRIISYTSGFIQVNATFSNHPTSIFVANQSAGGGGGFIDRTTAVAPYANRLSDGTAFYDARTIRALTSADVVTVANPTTTVTANLGTIAGIATETTLAALNNKFTAPSALTDSAANPTVQGYAAYNMIWNGTTWDRAMNDGTNNDADPVMSTGVLSVEAHNQVFNGTTWDRQRGTIANGTLVDVSRVQGLVTTLPTPNNLGVTAVGASGAAVTLTVPAVAANFHYMDSIEITLYSTAARTGAAAPITCTSTNLSGAHAWTWATAAVIGSADTRQVFNANRPIRSAVANTATTFVCPAVTNGLWRMNVVYSVGL
jgi:hypothetical protein